MQGCREFVRSRVVFVALAMLVSAARVSAQSIVDPQRAEFTPSADHSATTTEGVPLVQSYSLSIYQAGSTEALQTVNLGKPAPEADGKVRVAFLNLLNPAPVSGVIYEARISAIGPGGSATSDVSNTFSFSSTCGPSLTPASQTFSSSAGSGSVSLRTGTGCPWTAVSNASWLTIASGASGTESATVTFNVAQNTTTTDRNGALTIAGQVFSVTQTGATACAYTIAPASQSAAASGGTGSFTVSTTAGCAWTASTSANWITLTGTTSGSGNGTVTFSVAANTVTTPRTGTITVGGQTFTVTQAAASCTYSLAPVSQSVAAAGASGSFAVTSSGGCAWTATSNAPWISISGTASGSGNGTVAFTVAVNSVTTPRTGTITVAGQTFTVTQAAAQLPCAYSIAPVSQTVPAAGGSGSFTVTTTAGCAWSASSTASWIVVTAGASGSGSGTVTFSIAANSVTSQRVGTITAGGQTFTVDQAAAAPCTYSVSPSSQSVPAAGGTGSVAVTTLAGCGWSSYSNTSWITLTGSTGGTGNGTANFSVAANTGSTARTGTIMIAGQIVSVTQAAATTSCSYAIAPTSQSVPASGGSGSFSMTAAAGCAWSATSGATWITVTGTASGSGNGTVSFTVAANTTTTPRSGTIAVGGQTFTVNQAGTSTSCTTSISPTSQSVGSLGGTNWVTVTATAGCGWTAVSNASWLTVVGGASGTGSGTMTYSVAANTGAARTGTITVAGQTITVSQAAAACAYSVTPASVSVSKSATSGSLTVTVTAGAGCSWGSFSSTPWITVSGGGSGSGSATYTVAANTTGVARTGTILVAGKTIGFAQAGN